MTQDHGGDPLDDITFEPPSPASTEAVPVSSETPPAPPDSVAAPTDPPATVPASASAAPSVPGETQAPAAPVAWTPPPGDPFAFRLDGREQKPDGVLTKDGYVIWPQAAWQAFEKSVGSTEAWRHKEAGYARVIQDREAALAAKDAEIAQAKIDGEASVKAYQQLIELAQRSPEQFVQTLGDHIARMPLLVKEQVLALKEQQLSAVDERKRAAQQEEESAAVDQHLDAFTDRVVTYALGLDQFKVLGELPGAKDTLKADLLRAHAADIFAMVPPDKVIEAQGLGWQVAGHGMGKAILWHPGKVEEILTQRVTPLQTWRQQQLAALEADKRNKAAVAPVAPMPTVPKPVAKPVERPRDETGKFAKQDDAVAKRKAARAALDDLTLEDVTRA